MSRICLLFCFLLLQCPFLYCQDAVVSSGGEISGEGGTVSYSVGQIFVNTLSNVDIDVVVFQGIQQPYEVFFITPNPYDVNISLDVTAFPNPTTDILVLQLDDIDGKNLKYELFDSRGVILHSQFIESEVSEINMKEYSPSTYFIRITDGHHLLTILKIIKV